MYAVPHCEYVNYADKILVTASCFSLRDDRVFETPCFKWNTSALAKPDERVTESRERGGERWSYKGVGHYTATYSVIIPGVFISRSHSPFPLWIQVYLLLALPITDIEKKKKKIEQFTKEAVNFEKSTSCKRNVSSHTLEFFNFSKTWIWDKPCYVTLLRLIYY